MQRASRWERGAGVRSVSPRARKGKCGRLREAFAHARAQQHTRVIVLLGGDDYFSNGIHLNEIEAADNPAQESWRNLQAIDDLVKDILETDSYLVVSAVAGDAAAGGVPLALAGDYVLAREDTVLNPYYQHIGGLYRSEYWTYLLPRRVGAATTARLTSAPFRPVGSREAVRIGLLDAPSARTSRTFGRPLLASSNGPRMTGCTRHAQRTSDTGAPSTSVSNHSRHTARRRWRAATNASSVPTPPTTTRGGAFVYKLATPDTAREEPVRVAI